MLEPAWLVILAGVCAALHMGKLPPALPILQQELGISLLQSGFLLSLVQLAGMLFGIFIGLAADGIGQRRSMLIGLGVLALSSLQGAGAQDAASLLRWRALEGLGFLLVVLPAPNLIRLLVRPDQMNIMMGVWGTYMPLGTGLALLGGPALMALAGWQGLWWGLSLFTVLVMVWLGLAVPPEDKLKSISQSGTTGWLHRLRQTLSASGPWLVALSFAVYSAQWLAVIGFLPTIYTQAGYSGESTAILTAMVALVNILGNLLSGALQARAYRPEHLLYLGFLAMGMGTAFAFGGGSWGPSSRFISILLFSMIGGMVPATLFSLAVRLAPSDRTISTTVGWIQQWSAMGQFLGPPLVAWVAAGVGGWHATWWVTCACSLVGLALARLIARRLGG